MANHKSAKKRNRQRIVRTERGRSVRTRVRAVLKLAREAVAASTKEAGPLVKLASQLLDRAASKNVIPPNRASRLKSRLAKSVNRGSG